MKLGYKLVISFLIMTLIMGVFGFYMFNNISNKLSTKQEEVNKVSEIISAIQNFQRENYQTQLKMLEYAYKPSEDTLNQFFSHLINWETLFANFVLLSNAKHLSTQEYEIIAGDLQSGTFAVKSSWRNFVRTTASLATGTIDSPTLNDDGTVKYPYLDEMHSYGYDFSYPMFDMSTCDTSNPIFLESMTAMEDLFDKANFNINTDKFVALQQENLAAKQVEMDDLKSSLTTQFIIAFVIVVIAAVLIALLLTRMIVKPINDLTKLANEISQGKTELSVPKINTKDEIGDLATSFGRMVASIKFMMMDKEE
jgi:nitrogen fixation/metabolism regulation signal transduction histidine kinase